MESSIFTKELSSFNATRFACFYGDIAETGDIRFEEPDSEQFSEEKGVFIDIIYKSNPNETRCIKAFNNGDFDTVVKILETVHGKDFFLKYLFLVMHACIRTFGTQKFGDAKFTLDYYVYRLIELVYSPRMEDTLKRVAVHVTHVLKKCIEKNKDMSMTTRRFNSKNVFSEDSRQLKTALLKLGISSDSVFKKTMYSESYIVKVSDSKIYRRSIIVISLLYSIPGMGWSKEHCGVDLRIPGIVFSNKFDNRIESLSAELQGYSYIEKVIVTNKIIKAALVAFILTGCRLDMTNLTVLFNDSKNPSNWNVVNLVTSQFMTSVLFDETEMNIVDVIDSMSQNADSTVSSDGITMGTYGMFKLEYLTRARMWRDFFEFSDIVRGLREIDDQFIDAVSSRINTVIETLGITG